MRIRTFLSSGICVFFLSILFCVPSLEAAGWGKTSKQAEYEGVVWDGVYFDSNGLKFTASIPKFSGAGMQNGNVTLRGDGKDGSAYLISTSMNPGFTPPKSSQEFVKIVQDANPNYRVIALDGKKLGAKYVVDLIPKSTIDDAFWRFLCTENRLIRMGTDDHHTNRQLYFFDSMHIVNVHPWVDSIRFFGPLRSFGPPLF